MALKASGVGVSCHVLSSTMSTDLLVIVDDTHNEFSYTWAGGNTTSPWLGNKLSGWYGGSMMFPVSEPTQIGSFIFLFDGTSASFTGITPTSNWPQNCTVKIDQGAPFTIDYPIPATYMQWFSTPTLPDGRHIVTISDLYRTTIDYAVVKVGSQTPLNGQIVIVDDDSPLIQYSGQWSRSARTFILGYPYSNFTHLSSNPGDTFTFQFKGTSIAVYGMLDAGNVGSVTTTYTLDGMVHTEHNSNTSMGLIPNYVHFSRDNLVSGTHTLLVNITEANFDKFFTLDYITYKPSFDTLSSMPSLSPNGSSGTSSSNMSSATSSASSIASSNGGSRQSVSTGAIIGGVLGGVGGVLVAVLVIFFIVRRCRAREQNYALSYEGSHGNYLNYPHTTNSAQMQESSSNLQARPAKFAHTNDTVATPAVMTGGSPGIQEASANPPSYEAISNPI